MDDPGARRERTAVAVEERRSYLDSIVAGELEPARELVDQLLRRYSPERVILDVLAPAQIEIGLRWETNQCSVADEHVATSITDAVLAQVAAAVRFPGARSLVAVACVEGDWHTVPARMAAELLRAQGWHVRFLGGSLPAEDLQRYLARLKPAAVCLSCSLPLFLPGALRSIEAAHNVGVPVLVGGRGVGHDEHVSLRLGADGWARTVTGSKRQLTAWSRKAPGQLAKAAADTESWTAIQLSLSSLVDRTLENDQSGDPEDVANLFRLLAVALLVDDDRIFVDHVVWFHHVLSSRDGGSATVWTALPAMAQALADADLLTPKTERVLESAAAIGHPAVSLRARPSVTK